MAGNQSAAALSATKNTFNLLKDWQNSKENQKALGPKNCQHSSV